MINLKNLIDFLPPLFKSTDTYKVGNKGILERFLEVCGEYLEDVITPDIENTLDLIVLDKTDTIYLNYLWELLGEIPFANSPAIDKTQWDLYHSGTLSKEELDSLSSNWVIDKSGVILLDDQRVRELLKYALTLLKIRGTKKFFETLFKIYGIECTITDGTGSDTGVYANLLRTDNDNNLDVVSIDTNQQCDECLPINIDISTNYHYSGSDGLILLGIDNTFFMGKRYTPINTKQGVELYNQYSDPHSAPADLLDTWLGFIEFRKCIEQLFDKYLPCNVTPNITYNGISPDDNVQVQVTYLTGQHITNENPEVSIQVTVTSKYSRSGNKFYMSKDNITWGIKTFDSGHIFNIIEEGDFYFKSVDNPNKLDYLSVTKHKVLDPNYRFVIWGIDNQHYRDYNSTSTPVLWIFQNSNNVHTIKVMLKLFKGNQPYLYQEDVLVSINGKGSYKLWDYESETYLELPVGDNRVTWIDNPEVYIDIKVLRAFSLYGGELDDLSPKFKGLPYGVSGTFYQQESYREDKIVKKIKTSLGEYGTYGAIGTSSNRNGNVVTLSCTRDNAYNMELLVNNLKPWAYQYDELSNTVHPLDGLTKVDIWCCNTDVNMAYIVHAIGEGNLSDQVINNLQGPNIFYKVTTITPKPGETVDLTEYLGDPGWFIRGGILLLHPNTEEMISIGLKPNADVANSFYPNFLVVVVPPIDLEYSEDLTSTDNGFKYTEFSKVYQEYRDSKAINKDGKFMVSKYKRGDNLTSYVDLPLRYNYMAVNESRYSTNDITNQLYLKQEGFQGTNIDKTNYLGVTKSLVLNTKAYNSLDTRYFVDSVPTESNIESYPVLYYNVYIDISDFYWGYLETRNIIFIDYWAPFMNTQLMVKQHKPKGIPDGLYIKPMDIPEEDIINLPLTEFKKKYPEFPWDAQLVASCFYPNNPARGLIKVNETHPSGSNFRAVFVNTAYTESYGMRILNTNITPIKFQFVVYKNDEEWNKDYYLIDSNGIKYLPNHTYEISNFGSMTFTVVPNLTATSVSPIEDDYQPSFHEVTIINGRVSSGLFSQVKCELSLPSNDQKYIINTSKPGRTIFLRFNKISPVLGSGNTSLYEVVTDGHTDIILSKTLLNSGTKEITAPGNYSFILGYQQTTTSDLIIVSDILRVEVVDPYEV